MPIAGLVLEAGAQISNIEPERGARVGRSWLPKISADVMYVFFLIVAVLASTFSGWEEGTQRGEVPLFVTGG